MKKHPFFQNLISGFCFLRAMIFTFTVVALVLAGCKKERDIVAIDDDDCPPELVAFDYNGDRVAIEQYYRQNLYHYWANYGFPALSNLSKMLDDLGETNTQLHFESAATAFSSEMFFNALGSEQLPAPVVQDYLSLPASNPWFAVLKSIRRYGEQIYNAASEGNPAAAQLARDELQQLTTLCFDPDKLLALSVIGEKGFDAPPPAMVNVRLCCGKNHLSGFVQQPPASGAIDTTRIKWTDIVSSWKTQYNGSCAAVASGACAEKLGLLKSDVDSTGWDDFSKGIGAPKGGEGGAPVTGNPSIESWFGEKGYGMSTAHNGIAFGFPPYYESASEEAKRALDKGCDVMLWYINGDKSGHIEVVTAIDVDPNDSDKGTIQTLSWGQSATTTFESNKFSGKSDGNRYRPKDQNKGWLEGEGDAKLIYFCKN